MAMAPFQPIRLCHAISNYRNVEAWKPEGKAQPQYFKSAGSDAKTATVSCIQIFIS
jgi:hypothetical protein